jgi:methylenetetrahydrofolate reductase (NADPH)
VAATLTIELCRRLQAEGYHEFHFYTLNQSTATREIFQRLGV